MADDKRGRDKQAHDTERRQRVRELREARERSDEAEPPVDAEEELDGFEVTVEGHEYPATTGELVEAFGDREVEVRGTRRFIEDLLTPVGDATHVSATEVRARVEEQLDHR